MTHPPKRLPGLRAAAERLRDYADALELRAEGNRSAFDAATVHELVRTAVHIGDTLTALDALAPVSNIVPLHPKETSR